MGAMVAMSSTSIVVKVLADYRTSNTQQGQITIGTLIMQASKPALEMALLFLFSAGKLDSREGGAAMRCIDGCTAAATSWKQSRVVCEIAAVLALLCAITAADCRCLSQRLLYSLAAIAGLRGGPSVCLHACPGSFWRQLRL